MADKLNICLPFFFLNDIDVNMRHQKASTGFGLTPSGQEVWDMLGVISIF